MLRVSEEDVQKVLMLLHRRSERGTKPEMLSDATEPASAGARKPDVIPCRKNGIEDKRSFPNLKRHLGTIVITGGFIAMFSLVAIARGWLPVTFSGGLGPGES